MLRPRIAAPFKLALGLFALSAASAAAGEGPCAPTAPSGPCLRLVWQAEGYDERLALLNAALEGREEDRFALLSARISLRGAYLSDRGADLAAALNDVIEAKALAAPDDAYARAEVLQAEAGVWSNLALHEAQTDAMPFDRGLAGWRAAEAIFEGLGAAGNRPRGWMLANQAQIAATRARRLGATRAQVEAGMEAARRAMDVAGRLPDGALYEAAERSLIDLEEALQAPENAPLGDAAPL